MALPSRLASIEWKITKTSERASGASSFRSCSALHISPKSYARLRVARFIHRCESCVLHGAPPSSTRQLLRASQHCQWIWCIIGKTVWLPYHPRSISVLKSMTGFREFQGETFSSSCWSAIPGIHSTCRASSSWLVPNWSGQQGFFSSLSPCS